MKKFHAFFTLAVACCLIQFVSCTKTNNTAGDAVGLISADEASTAAKKCRITSFTQAGIPISPGTRTVEVYYNRHGDIDSMIADLQTSTLGLERFYFTYDKNHKLIAYREDAGESYFYEERHTYAYEKGRIVRDSIRYTGEVYTEVRTLEYDKEGRVIKESMKIVDFDGTVTEYNPPMIYSYDLEGNLVSGTAAYDDGINFLSTSEQLQFTQRDYSRNNRAQATAYNEAGLPLGFAQGVRPAYSPSNLFSFGLPITITYDCK